MLHSFLKKSEALLITSSPNIFYYSGIQGEGGLFLLFTPRKRFLFTDARFIREAARIAKGFIPIETAKEDYEWWGARLKHERIKTVYFEPRDLTYYKFKNFQKMSRGAARLKPAKIDFRELRSVKKQKELMYLKRAVRMSEMVLKEIISQIKRRERALSEHDVALEIMRLALLHGLSELSFSPIVAFGRNTGIPHHRPLPRRILQKGEAVLIDMGIKYKGYCADITRTFFTAPPGARQIEIYNHVLAAQTAVIDLIKQGVCAQNLYNEATLKLGAFHEHFTHGLGHGVGLEIHEHPNLKQKSPDVLQIGQVLTVEPGLYFSYGGVRIEDMVEVRDKGARALTLFPKDIKSAVLL